MWNKVELVFSRLRLNLSVSWKDYRLFAFCHYFWFYISKLWFASRSKLALAIVRVIQVLLRYIWRSVFSWKFSKLVKFFLVIWGLKSRCLRFLRDNCLLRWYNVWRLLWCLRRIVNTLSSKLLSEVLCSCLVKSAKFSWLWNSKRNRSCFLFHFNIAFLKLCHYPGKFSKQLNRLFIIFLKTFVQRFWNSMCAFDFHIL